MRPKIKRNHVDKTDFQEIVLDERSGRKRVYFFCSTETSALYQLFSNYKMNHLNHFKLPNAIKGQHMMRWAESDSIILELKSLDPKD